MVRAMTVHGSCLGRYWGLWAVQQLHGVQSLLATLRTNCDVFNEKSEKVVKSTLRSLSFLAKSGGIHCMKHGGLYCNQ